MSGADSVSIDSDPEGPGIFSIGYKSSPVSFFYMGWCGNRYLLNQRFEFLILVKKKDRYTSMQKCRKIASISWF
jgi:hypothetical protein